MAEPLADSISSSFLQGAILALRQKIVPALVTPESRIYADFVTRILYMLHSRFSQRGEDLKQLIEHDRTVQKEIEALLTHLPRTAETMPAPPPFSVIEKLERHRYETETELAGQIPRLIAMARKDSASRNAAMAALRKIVDVQRQFMAAQDPDTLKGRAVWHQGGRIDEERPLQRLAIMGAEITEASLTQYLQKRFPGAGVQNFAPMTGGLSKTTIVFTLVKASGETDALVIRKDLPVDFVSSVADEFPLLMRLHEEGIPIAEPLWLESDLQPFGGRFMVSRRVAGSTDVSRWAGDKEAVGNFARQLAKIMADIHALKITEFGYLPQLAAKSAGELMEEEIARLYEVFLRTRKEVHPLEELAMAWIKANIPATLYSRRGSLVHGDNGFHNLMIDNGRVTALLDWEFAHPGDPIEDLVYAKPYIEKLMDWETFKTYYGEYGGANCTVEEEVFYTIWSNARNAIRALQISTIFTDALPYDIRFAVSGLFGSYMELEVGEMVLDALGTS